MTIAIKVSLVENLLGTVSTLECWFSMFFEILASAEVGCIFLSAVNSVGEIFY